MIAVIKQLKHNIIILSNPDKINIIKTKERKFMQLSAGYIILCLAGIFILYILCKIFIRPLKWFLRLALSCLLGCIIMIAINKLFAKNGIYIGINPLSAMLSGVLGIPGIIIAYLLQGII